MHAAYTWSRIGLELSGVKHNLHKCQGNFSIINLLLLDEAYGSSGLGVACWPLVPKFVGSNPAEAVGFLGQKNPQHTFLRRGSKAIGPMS